MKRLVTFFLLFITVNAFSQVVEDAWIKAPLPGMKMTGGYMVIKNNTDQDIYLEKVTGNDCEAYEIHTHTKVDGVMKMRQLEKLKIKANQSVTLKPKSFHIMMIQLTKKLELGKKSKMTLHFSNKKLVEISPIVRAMK